MRAALVCDEAQLVHAGDQRPKDTHVHKADKVGRCFCRVKSDRGVDAPEDSDRADDEQDEDVDRGDDVGIKISIDEIRLDHSQLFLYSF